MGAPLYATRTHHSLAELKKLQKQSQDHRLKERLLCIIWSLADSLTAPQIAKRLLRNPQTVRDWIKNYNEAGLQALKYEPAGGRPAFLSPQDEAFVIALLQKSPEDYGFAGSLWDCQTLATVFFKEQQREVHKDVIWRMFRRLKFSYKKAQGYNPKGDKEKKTRFKQSWNR